MFIDRCRILIKGGDGGNGMSSFRREKYVPAGGPDGGDGGKGGDVYFIVEPGLRTLMDFKYKRHFKAESGAHGQGKGMYGRNGQDLIIKVPEGTVVKDAETGEIAADLRTAGHKFLAAKGGRGGRGNMHFATPQRRTPTFAEKGEPGVERWVDLELKLLADVGLVGFPNAGKSTLISRVSAAKPKIADYPFTTLEPNLGVVDLGDDEQFVIADIPGLIEGAHEGLGLGHQFLRHIERTRVLIYVIDIAGTEGRDPVSDFEILLTELSRYNENLAARPAIIAANKVDLGNFDENLENLRRSAQEKGYSVYPISGVTGLGLPELMRLVSDMLASMPIDNTKSPVTDAASWEPGEARPLKVEMVDGIYEVTGTQVERLAAMTDFMNEAALRRFQKVLVSTGVVDALKEKGAKTGDGVRIGKFEFDFVE